MSAQSPWLLGPPQLQTQSRRSRASAAFALQPANASSSTAAAGQDGEAQPSAEASNVSKVGASQCAGRSSEPPHTAAEVSSGCLVVQAAASLPPQSSMHGIQVVLSGAEVAAVQPPAISSEGSPVCTGGLQSDPRAPSSPALSHLFSTSRFVLFPSQSLSKSIHQCRCPLECVCARAYRTRSSGCGVHNTECNHTTPTFGNTQTRALSHIHTHPHADTSSHTHESLKSRNNAELSAALPLRGLRQRAWTRARTHARTHARRSARGCARRGEGVSARAQFIIICARFICAFSLYMQSCRTSGSVCAMHALYRAREKVSEGGSERETERVYSKWYCITGLPVEWRAPTPHRPAGLQSFML